MLARLQNASRRSLAIGASILAVILFLTVNLIAALSLVGMLVLRSSVRDLARELRRGEEGP